MKGYNDYETARLIKMAAEAEKTGESLTTVFGRFALETGRARGSVRNYYYQLLKKALSDESVKEKFPLLKDISVSKNVSFTDREENDLMLSIETGVREGKSVRRAIYDLAGGDAKLALRYQNKYRNMQKCVKSRLFDDKDLAYRQLADKINGLIERIGRSVKSENAALKEKVRLLTEENERLKKRLGGGVISGYFSGDAKTGDMTENG